MERQIQENIFFSLSGLFSSLSTSALSEGREITPASPVILIWCSYSPAAFKRKKKGMNSLSVVVGPAAMTTGLNGVLVGCPITVNFQQDVIWMVII